MTVVVFENPGEIDPLAIATFGVSVKERDDPIGFFGTGLKYALAILLREGHSVEIQSGVRAHAFGLREVDIRGAPFQLVTIDREPMGFTTQVGKTWEVWMAYRELYCNCKDEGGGVYVADQAPPPAAGVTRVVVEGAALCAEHAARSSFILAGEPFLKLEGSEVHAGNSRGVFYRGIMVHRFPAAETSRFTYNMTRSVDLTEDRTAKYPSFIPMQLAADVLGAADDGFLRELLTVDNKFYEHHFDFREAGVWGGGYAKPSPAFIGAVEALARDRAARTNASAVARYKAAKRADLAPDTTPLRGVEAAALARAVAFCKALGFPVDEYPLVLTDTLGAGVLGMAEGGRIYLSRRAFMVGTKCVAGTLIEEFVHLKHGYADESRELQNFLLDRLVSLGEELQGEPL